MIFLGRCPPRLCRGWAAASRWAKGTDEAARKADSEKNVRRLNNMRRGYFLREKMPRNFHRRAERKGAGASLHARQLPCEQPVARRGLTRPIRCLGSVGTMQRQPVSGS